MRFFGMQTASLPPVAVHRNPRVKQLPHIKESNWPWLKYHCHVIVSLCLVLLESNLTHFVHTIEENWGHALQFWPPPRAFPTSLTRSSWAVDAQSLVSYPVEWEMGCNERESWGSRGEQVAWCFRGGRQHQMSRGVKKLGAFWVKALRIWVYQLVITFLVTLWSAGGEWNAGKDLYAQGMGQRQGERILYGCCSTDPRLWLQAAVSTYSFIIQSNICALTVSLPHNFPPSTPNKIWQNWTSHPCGFIL